MRRASIEHRKALKRKDANTIHDLRVALRRCRSLVKGLNEIEPHRCLKEIDLLGKTLFKQQGSLRDAQVTGSWIKSLVSKKNQVRAVLLKSLKKHEDKNQKKSQKALKKFPSKKWEKLVRSASKLHLHLMPDGPEFKQTAANRCQDAYQLHRLAIKTFNDKPNHKLRITFKKFRYTVENFLPSLHKRWGKKLKHIQNLLGEAHDLYVLDCLLSEQRREIKSKDFNCFRNTVRRERLKRLKTYRKLTTGKNSYWLKWQKVLRH